MPVNELSTHARADAVSAEQPVTVVADDPVMLAVADAVVVLDAMGAAMPEVATGRAGMEAGMLPRLVAGNAACRRKERERGKERKEREAQAVPSMSMQCCTVYYHSIY